MKRAAALLGLLIGLACLAFFIKSLSTHWAAFRSLALGGPVLIGIGCSLACYLLTYSCSSRSWQLMLRVLGVFLSFRHCLQIISISQFGKYIPGNVGQHLGRIVLARTFRVDASQSIASMGLETFLLIAAASVCSLAAIESLPMISRLYGDSIKANILIAAALILLIVVVVVAVPWSRARLRPLIHILLRSISLRTLSVSAQAMILHMISFGLGGLSLWLAIGVMAGHAEPFSPSLIGIYAVAWLVGFVVPGAPAGLGIREALLVLGLTPLYGGGVAATATALFRLITIIGDGVAFALGLALRRGDGFVGHLRPDTSSE